ncbi:DUF2971 domain-containing protein [Bacillus stercoris]|uniref:DUF2971 domain-containing protein n=1 Tax=Bacillus stercoris TaxID=2054641 RepID=UPI003F766C56
MKTTKRKENTVDIGMDFDYFFERHISELLKRTVPEVIYHYTDIYGLEGILNRCEFWVSHSDFLNDKTEIKYTVELSRKLFIELCKKRGFNQVKINQYIEFYDKIAKINFVDNKNNYYTLSFCTNPDSNLLWSNYSNNDGYSISFNHNDLHSKWLTSDKPYFVLSAYVIYNKEKQVTLLNNLLTDIIDILESQNEIELTYEIMMAFGILDWYSIFFKDECFSQEQEYRVAFHFNDNKESYKCRISNGMFIPYVEISFNDNAVCGITIGPKNNMDINLEGLRKFLQLKKIRLEEDQIKKSSIPYRY